ncbi:MAG: C-terminal binding protein [Chloroflexi bacterium]|nr:C-terminal binding protein [Chloroflexota bacterium]
MSTQGFKVYYIGEREGDDLSDARDALEKAGATLEILPFLRDEDEIVRRTKDADGVIVSSAPMTRKVLSALKRCKVVLRTGVGYDVIDVEAATELGMAVVNIPDMWTQEVANQAFSLLLACNRRVAELDRLVKSGHWDDRIPVSVGSLYDETLGMIGVGQIGSALARRAAAFDMNVIASDPYVSEQRFNELRVTGVSLDVLLEKSDYVSVNCPLTAETRHLVNEEALRRMKPTAYLINTARGPVVDEAALIRALQEGWIAGAGLDVLEEEPPRADNPLLSMTSVVLSSHVGHFSDASIARRPRRYGEEVARVLTGRMPLHLVNPQVREVLPLRDD